MQENDNRGQSDRYTPSREILIVEDDVALCRMLTSFLAKHGWIVHAVHTGQQALEIFRRNRLAMILLDIGLPDYSGFDLMREMHRFVDTPVIVISAHGEETDRIVGLELGADDYLAKPFSLRDLQRTRELGHRAAEVAGLTQHPPSIEMCVRGLEAHPFIAGPATEILRLQKMRLSIGFKRRIEVPMRLRLAATLVPLRCGLSMAQLRSNGEQGSTEEKKKDRFF